jgi:hypothetical protein
LKKLLSLSQLYLLHTFICYRWWSWFLFHVFTVSFSWMENFCIFSGLVYVYERTISSLPSLANRQTWNWIAQNLSLAGEIQKSMTWRIYKLENRKSHSHQSRHLIYYFWERDFFLTRDQKRIIDGGTRKHTSNIQQDIKMQSTKLWGPNKLFSMRKRRTRSPR